MPPILGVEELYFLTFFYLALFDNGDRLKILLKKDIAIPAYIIERN